MKVVALNASARKDGNTAILLNTVLDELRAEGMETELIQLGGKTLHWLPPPVINVPRHETGIVCRKKICSTIFWIKCSLPTAFSWDRPLTSQM